MSKLPYLIFFAGLFLCLQSSEQFRVLGQCETKLPAPVFNGDKIQSPPNQTAPWKRPQTLLPEKFVTATATLFEQGLADPRDCEYRQIEVVVGSVWGGYGVCKTHGWVLPSKSPSEAPRFGIGWNGLVYPLVSVGAPANLSEDILTLVQKDDALRARYKIESPDFPFYRFRNAISNFGSMSHEVLLPLKAGLLLRLGYTDLAEKIWNAWTAGMNAKANDDAIHLEDPYLMLASEWAWALFDRAVTAHMRGDDRLSLLSARSLMAIETSIEAEVDRRRIIPPERIYVTPGQRTRYLTFLGQLPVLLADEERRVREESNARKETLQDTLRITDPQLRVAELVRQLDEVTAWQHGQPGGVNLYQSEIVQALIAQGDAAVNPLLNVIENDTRLTRSVSFSRDFHWNRHLIGVHEAAYVALSRILKTDYASGAEWETMRQGSLDARRGVAARIRKYLKEFSGLSWEERWYRILSDDHASADQWLEAAAFIIQRSDYNDPPPPWAFHDSRAPKPGDAFHLRGEPLRTRTNPTVSQLLVRRMRDLAQRGAQENSDLTIQKAVKFALGLGTWDGPAHITELQRLMSGIVEQYAKARDLRPSLIGQIVSLTLKRYELEDKQALSEYAAWLRTVRPADTGLSTVLLFEPALRYPSAPEIERTIGWMFLDAASPWVPLVPRYVDYYVDTAKLLEKLMDFTAFREQILKNLNDKTYVGTLIPRPASPNDKYDLKVENNIAAVAAGAPNSAAVVVSISTSDARAPRPPLQIGGLRVCDVYAWKLRGYEGAPRIELYWTEAERDAAIATLITFLHEHRGKFVYSPERAYRYTQ